MYPGNKFLPSKGSGISSETRSEAILATPFTGYRVDFWEGNEKVSVQNETIFSPGCPECGGKLVRIGGCFSCVICGWGACD